MVNPRGLPPTRSVNCDCPGMQDVFLGAACMLDQVSEQRAVGLVAACALRRAHQIEFALQRRQRQKIIINIGDDRQPLAARQLIQRADHVVV
jgi:hypothetical protein